MEKKVIRTCVAYVLLVGVKTWGFWACEGGMEYVCTVSLLLPHRLSNLFFFAPHLRAGLGIAWLRLQNESAQRSTTHRLTYRSCARMGH